MRILGIQGSPRKKGNTSYLLATCMEKAKELGAVTHTVDADKQNIMPCKEYLVCEKKGYCPIKDDMHSEIYTLLRQADIIIAASPVFFYNVTAQLKALIDRCQTFWARKYRLKLKDPRAGMRRGAMLSVAATRGKNLFEAVELTAKYFYDAVDAKYEGGLFYRDIEHAKDMAAHPTVKTDVSELMTRLVTPFSNRKRILFACRENACRSQIAGAFAREMRGDGFEIITGGSTPAESVNKKMVAAMAEVGLDVYFEKPQSLTEALLEGPPEVIVTMGCKEACPHVPGATHVDWDLADPADESPEFMRTTRDEIKKRVVKLLNEL